jgi:RNA polymerase sigma-70 factor (ECF subfamily)
LLAALTRVFGVASLALAEDVVQETLARAFESWTFGAGVPEHYSALLMVSAKNRAIDVCRRERNAQRFAPELGRLIASEWTLRPAVEELFLPPALKDDELRMMFLSCHPQLNEDAQVAVMLNLACGFHAKEIASFYLVSEAAMEKRISRAKKILAASPRRFELTAEDFAPRLPAVHRTLYLLFSEGYHGAGDAVTRSELCGEAMRLGRLLVDHAPVATSTSFALAALMYFGAARLAGRADALGNLTVLAEQDRSRWDPRLIAEGVVLLERSAVGSEASAYHLEAAISGMHATAARHEDTRWGEIVGLYDALMVVRASPVVALNRAMAIAQFEGPAAGLRAIRAIEGVERLAAYPFHEAALGELELRCGRKQIAGEHFQAALRLARNAAERSFLDQRLSDCRE